jgi:predicted nucleotidyltransferase
VKELSSRFSKGIKAVQSLEKNPRYEAAFIFGSVAEGTSSNKSDLDVKVITNEDNPCDNINHPAFDDYKLDLTFSSFKQFKKVTQDDVQKAEREPNLIRGVIVFDKTGELTRLQHQVKNAKPKKYTEKDHQFFQFMLYHANNKVERVLEDDPVSSLYSMHANIGEVLKMHYKLNQKWWVSSKNILANLKTWDKALANTLADFVQTADVKKKFKYWTQIVDHVAANMGGRQAITENNCNCEVCTMDLSNLTS